LWYHFRHRAVVDFPPLATQKTKIDLIGHQSFTRHPTITQEAFDPVLSKKPLAILSSESLIRLSNICGRKRNKKWKILNGLSKGEWLAQ
jgi:hypothetical protein